MRHLGKSLDATCRGEDWSVSLGHRLFRSLSTEYRVRQSSLYVKAKIDSNIESLVLIKLSLAFYASYNPIYLSLIV